MAEKNKQELVKLQGLGRVLDPRTKCSSLRPVLMTLIHVSGYCPHRNITQLKMSLFHYITITSLPYELLYCR